MSTPAVVFGGPSPEHDISILTGLQAARTLIDAGTPVDAIYWSKAGGWHSVDPESEAADFADGVPGKARELRFVAEPGGGFMQKRKQMAIGGVLLCCHGGPGEDGTLQAAFDLAGLAYTGPDAAGSALGMDKFAFGAAAAAAGLPTLPRVLVGAGARPTFEPPFIVKPRFGGSSIGIEVVEDHQTALDLAAASPHMTRGAVLEPFLEGSRDLNIAIRSFPELELSAIEAPVRGDGDGFYDYTEKYLSGGGLEGSQRELPAQLDPALREQLHAASTVVAGLIGVRSIARLDFLERNGELWVNEINTIPGSLSAYLWVDPPVSRRQLMLDIVAELRGLHPRRFSTAGADGIALRSAGAIASKLG